ncbi:TonB dependent receptor [Raineya orbicola]|uniref:TonB dependent receptor n=2 Tax=Raineya orbicola TaxID=2016530 RepID=A0A2N3IHA9_9BACT|nr:TonB dependent receptor [Raineya orbicola]
MRQLFYTMLFLPLMTWGQTFNISGKIAFRQSNEPITNGIIALQGTKFQSQVQPNGNFTLTAIPQGKYVLIAFAENAKTYFQEIELNKDLFLNIVLESFENEIEAITVQAEKERLLGLTRLQNVENFGIYESKKNEVIEIGNLTANFATNNARQIFSRITGLNIWESDQAGLQLGIGGRGLNPNRTSNFNVRQNGYDISADALGYPESYYTPPVEALERIEIVRGAASLQYGTQFGGMLNFKFKRGSEKKIELTSRQSVGSWGFWSAFNSAGGTIGKLNYYAYYLYKTGKGYRPNSAFNYHNFYTSLEYAFSKKFSATWQFTKMQYLAQQPGGLTDKNFEENPRQSLRERNWFCVDWNLLALLFTYKLNDNSQINIRNFGLLAQRLALGNLERANVADFGKERTLIAGKFQNFGSEIRFLHHYKVSNQKHTILLGARIYQGNSTAQQGFGTNSSDANFTFLNPDDVEDSNYRFPNTNYSFFAENIFQINDKWSITPGIRYENIQTFAEGYYKRYVKDGAGNIIVQDKISENLARKRGFVFAGVGVSYKMKPQAEIYANFSQNYRAINFTDLRINNPNLRIDANIQDEKGFTADVGLRGKSYDFFNYEITLFYLSYKGKIGQVLRTDSVLFNDYRFRTNVSDARNIGVEAFGEISLLPLVGKENSAWKWAIFGNFAFIDARYVHTQESSIRNRKVEMVPPITLRVGNTLQYKNFSTTLQYAYTAEHFSDATNTRRTASAIEGIIPAYSVVDLSFSYTWRFLRAEFSVNNLLNEKYFTRRAEGYPGPGIIPADGRGFYGTLQVKW